MAVKCKIVRGKEVCPKPDLFMSKYLDKGIFHDFSIEALEVFDLMDTDPPTELKETMATFIDSQVASGNWALMLPYQFILYGMDTAANSVINWMNANFNAVNAGSPHVQWSVGHSGFAGFSPDGATLYVNAGIAPDALGQDDVRVGVWLFTNDDAGAAALFGARDGVAATDLFIQQLGGGNKYDCAANSSNRVDFVITPGVLLDHSFYEVTRPDSANQALFENGVQLATDTDASTGLGSVNIYDGGFNLSGSLSTAMDCNLTARYVAPNTGFDPVNFHANLLIMLQSMGIEA